MRLRHPIEPMSAPHRWPRLAPRARLAAATALLLAACGGRHLPVTPPHPDPEVGFSAATLERPGIPDDTPESLRLRPGDAVTVEVVSTTTQLIPDVMVDATGSVHLPLVRDVAVGGLSLTEAEERILARWKPLDRLVQIHLRITQYGGQRAVVLGAVGQQGSVQLVPGSRVADVIATAGGPNLGDAAPSLVADLSGAVLERGGKTLPIDFRRALRGEPSHNVYVQPGDTIYIPPARGNVITVLGQVGGSTVLAFHDGLRLTEALARAGGVNAGGDKHDVRIIRGTLAEPRVYRSSLAQLVRGEVHNVELRPGDIVFVSDHWVDDMGEVMGVVTPLLSLTLNAATLSIAAGR